MSAVIDRPDIGYDDPSHSYTIDGVPVPGVSSIAKIGGDSWGPGGWWGWKVALTGVAEHIADGYDLAGWTLDDLIGALKEARQTPNAVRDAAGDRGNSVHDALERLAQDNEIPDPSDYPTSERGHVRSLVRWFNHYRPSFVATEVMVGSRKHMYAGRYDIRALIERERLGLPPVDSLDGHALCLIDLKTSKGCYPDTHFPQLEGYELASVEMGFPPTEGGRWLLRTSEDGSFVAHDALPAHKWADTNFVKSWATAETFIGYLAAYRERERMAQADPSIEWRRQAERTLRRALADGPALSRDLAKLCDAIELGLDSRTIGRMLSKLDGIKQGERKRWELIA